MATGEKASGMQRAYFPLFAFFYLCHFVCDTSKIMLCIKKSL